MSCKTSAVISGFDLEPTVSSKEADRRRKAKAERDTNIMLFFPEVILAGCVALGAPVWAISLALHGHAIAATLLISGVALGVIGFFWSIERGNKWLAYFAMLVVLLVAYSVYSVAIPEAR